jgi:hypothetical protein
MEILKLGDKGAGVADVQSRLVLIGFLPEGAVNGNFDSATSDALRAFAQTSGVTFEGALDDKLWSALVDATYNLGDRTLYLRMPYFHGHDVLELQRALGALGFADSAEDGIFGAHTEHALRNFQTNLGLPSDGIAGAYTYAALHNLEHSWVGKAALRGVRPVGFARASDVLESNAICLFGTCEFTRSVASRMSNLALATNPASHIVSADALSVAPDKTVLLMHISLLDQKDAEGVTGARTGSAAKTPRDSVVPVVTYSDTQALSVRLASAIDAAFSQVKSGASNLPRVEVVLPGTVWMEAGQERTAQHFAITLLDAICNALAEG